jgi:hypothetical protein
MMLHIMKKQLLFLGVLTAIVFAACKEKGPLIDFGGIKFKDTTYVTTPESSTARVIVVEEFTGGKCPNCPGAREKLAQMEAANPKRILSIELHPYEHSLGGPYPGAKYDFRNGTVSQLLSLHFGGSLSQIPIAGIDRVTNTFSASPFNGKKLFDRDYWSPAITPRLAMSSPANMKIEDVSYDNASRIVTFKVRIAYTDTISSKQFVSVAILEDSVVDYQEFLDSIDHNYTFKNILRDYATSVTGNPILTTLSTIEKGRVYEGYYSDTINAAWKPEHCRLIGILHNNTGSNKEVIQATDAHVKP